MSEKSVCVCVCLCLGRARALRLCARVRCICARACAAFVRASALRLCSRALTTSRWCLASLGPGWQHPVVLLAAPCHSGLDQFAVSVIQIADQKYKVVLVFQRNTCWEAVDAFALLYACVCVHACVHVCVCVCVRERER